MKKATNKIIILFLSIVLFIGGGLSIIFAENKDITKSLNDGLNITKDEMNELEALQHEVFNVTYTVKDKVIYEEVEKESIVQKASSLEQDNPNFKCWVDEDGNEFNTMSQINKNYNLKAIFEEFDDVVNKHDDSARLTEKKDDSTTVTEGKNDDLKHVFENKDAEKDAIERSLNINDSGDEFNENDWNIDRSNPNTWIIRSLRNKEIKTAYIPGEYDKKQIVLDRSLITYIKDFEKLTLKEVNGKKVKVEDPRFFHFYESMFRELDLEGLDLSNFDSLGKFFSSMPNLEVLRISTWNTSHIRDMDYLFENTSSLKVIDISKWDTSNVRDMSYMFSGASSLDTLDISKWNTSNVENMSGMFEEMSAIQKLNLNKWNTSRVQDMFAMFSGTSKLSELEISDWDISSLRSSALMFRNAYSLSDIDLENWDTSNVKTMGGMFSGTKSIKHLDLSSWDTSNLENISGMFSEMDSLESIKVFKLDTKNIKNMLGTFRDLKVLTELDLSSWDVDSVSNMRWMFENSSNLTRIDMSNFDFQTDTSYLLYAFYTKFKQPLIFISQDPTIANYNFEKDNREIVRGAIKDADKGVFKDGSQKKSFNDKFVVPDKSYVDIEPSKYDMWMNEDIPTRLNSNAKFLRWEGYDFKEEITDIRDDKSIYKAIYGYHVTFIVDGKETNVVVEENKKLPTDLIPLANKKNHTFVGWNTKRDGTGEVFDPKTDVIKDQIELFAMFEIKHYTVRYDVDGIVTKETVDHGNNIQKAPTPHKEGYEFVNWIDEAGNDFDLTQTIIRDESLSAVFKIKHYTVRYDVDGIVTKETVDHGNNIQKAPTPHKEGYEFVNWIDEAGNDFDLTQTIVKDEVLTAVFVKKEVTVIDPQALSKGGEDTDLNEESPVSRGGQNKAVNTAVKNEETKYIVMLLGLIYITVIITKKKLKNNKQ